MIWFLALILALARPAAAFDVPPARAFVTDQAGVLPDERERALEARLRAVARTRGIELAVFTVADLGGETIEGAAQRVFDAWKMGTKGQDRGALFLIAPRERKVRIQVGYGLEGELPDGKVGALLDQHVLARFRQGDLAGGIEAGVQAVLAELNAADPPPLPRPVRRGRPAADPVSTAVLVGLIVLLALGSAVSPGFRRMLGDLLFYMLIFGRGGGGHHRPGGDDGGGFGGFGGGSSGGGGASRGW